MTRSDTLIRPVGRHAESAERRTIGRASVLVASVLVAAGSALALANLLSLSALALLGALAAGVAAVKERPHRPFGWIVTALAAVGLAIVTIASIIARP